MRNNQKKKSVVGAVCFLLLFVSFFMLSKVEINAKDNSQLYHRHAGNTGGGGCYTTPSFCGGSMREDTLNPHGCGISAVSGGCPHCGCWYEAPSSKYPSGCAHCNCPKPRVNRCTVCGAESGGGTCTRVTKYSPSCGKNEGTLLARMSLRKSTEEWCREMTVEVIPEIIDESEIKRPFDLFWNEEAVGEMLTYPILSNGTYQSIWKIPYLGGSRELRGIVTIENIDKNPPQIQEIAEETEFVKERILQLQANDIQEDGTAGSGIHVQGYSFDEGMTWQESNAVTISQNKIYKMVVRDQLDNQSKMEIEVKNIDCMAPALQIQVEDKTIKINAQDLQEDGSQGVGLDDLPYSFDGGVNWTESQEYLAPKAGDYQIVVRDKLGNSTGEVIRIEEKIIPEEPSKEQKPEDEVIKEEAIVEEEESSIEEVEATVEASIEPNIEAESLVEETETIEIVEVSVEPLQQKEIEIPQKERLEQKKEYGKTLQVVAASTISLVTLLFIGALLYLYYVCVRIYEVLENEKEHLIGIVFLWKEDEFCLHIGSEIKQRASVNDLKIKMGRLFAKRHYLEKIIILMEEQRTSKEIDREIMLRLN